MKSSTNKSLNDRLVYNSFKLSNNQLIKSSNRPDIVRKFHFKFIRFLMIPSIDKVAKEYQIHRKYVEIKFRIINSFQKVLFPT